MIKKFEMFNENYGTIIDGELVDTYGGDSTYRDVWYEIENGEYFFYERYYGAKPSDTERITDEEEIVYERVVELGNFSYICYL